MPIVVQLRLATFTDPTSRASLAAMSAIHELVLIGTRHALPEDGVWQLRQTLAPRRMVVLLIEDYLPGAERALTEELLNDGIIPVILTRCDSVPPDLTSWLHPDEPDVRLRPHRAARGPRSQICHPPPPEAITVPNIDLLT